MTRTFLLIVLLVSIMLGSFIWFVATWDPSERPTISHNGSAPSSCQKTSGGVGAGPHSDLCQRHRA